VSALQRRKGADGERELARLLREALGAGVFRNLDQPRQGGADLLGIAGWAIEVKRAAGVVESLGPIGPIPQTESQARPLTRLGRLVVASLHTSRRAGV